MSFHSASLGQANATVPPLEDFRSHVRTASFSPVVVLGLVRAADVAMISTLGVGLFGAYVHGAGGESPWPYVTVSLGVGLLICMLLQATGHYSIANLRSPISQLSRLALSWISVFGLLVSAVFFLKAGSELSRVWLVAWFAAGAVTITIARISLAGLIASWTRQGRLVRRAVVVGGGPDGETLLRRLEGEANDLRICGIFDDRGDHRIGRVVSGYPKLGTVADLADFSRRSRVDLVLVALPTRAEERLLALLKMLLILPIDIKLSSLAARLRLSPSAYSYIGTTPFLDIADRPIANWASIQKWLFDQVFASLAIIALAPVMLATAIAIKLDSRGPVLFKQKRYGFNNELIEVFKFRSMYTHQSDVNANRLVTKDDPRVTKVGRFIRKASIDELPQLFNVLRGELSLVGPRPHALAAKAADTLYPEAVDGYFARHKVKPGVTGWAQINGWRGETDTEDKIIKRVEHDLYYIDHWSVALDLYILLKTPLALLHSQNAY